MTELASAVGLVHKCLCPPSRNGYLVQQVTVGSIYVAGCSSYAIPLGGGGMVVIARMVG